MSRTRPLSVRPLTDAERQALQDSVRSPDAFVRRRAQIVLASAAGQSSEQIAPRVGFTTQGVRDVIQAFNARGLDVARFGSYQPGVAGSALEGSRAPALHAQHQQSPRPCDHDTTSWSLEVAPDVADEQRWTTPRVGGVPMRTTRARMGVRRLRADAWLISPDREYARKQAGRNRLIRLAQGHPDWLLGCADEVWPSRLAHSDLRGSVNDRRATPDPQPPLPQGERGSRTPLPPAPAPSHGEGAYPPSGSRASPLPRTGRGAGSEGTSSLRQDNSQTLPDLHAGQDDDHALRLANQTVTCYDSAPETQAQRVRFIRVPRPALLQRPAWLRRLPMATLALMFTLLPLQEHFISRRTAHARIQRLTWRREALWIAVIALGAALAHGINMLNYPVYLGDEGIYTAQAWAVMKEAKLDPFTYTYGHAPAGWILLAAWAVVTGGFHTFGTTIDSGRVLMLILQVGSTCMLYHIARSISHSITVASAACLLFALSPYGIYSHREVLLDNIATFWMLLSIMLLVSRRFSLSRVWLSAVSLSLSVLSKENTIFIVPALAYLVFCRAHRSHRWFAAVGWPVIIVSLVSLYILMATIKGELFPTGTLLGGTNPHVSLMSSLQWQTNREKDRGLMDSRSKFWQVTRFWIQTDPLVVAGGTFCAFLAVLSIKRQRLVGVMGAATLSLWIFLARGSVILGFYLVPLLPLSALSVALVLGLAANSVTTFLVRYIGLSSIVARRMQMVVVAACLAGLATAYSSPALGLKDNPLLLWRSSQAAAAVRDVLAWTGEYIPSCSRIIVDPIMWTDLRDRQDVKNSFRLVYTHWEAATDPAIRDNVFHDNWRNVDYLIATPGTMFDIRANHLQLVQNVWAHSTVVARFDQKEWPIEIRRVNNETARPVHTCGSNGGPRSLASDAKALRGRRDAARLARRSTGSRTTLYFAEGYTGLLHTNGKATFDESLTVHNSSPVTATVTITYLFGHGRPVVVTRTIEPHGTRRESVNADIGPDKVAADSGPHKVAAAVVSSAARITAARINRRVGARGVSLKS